MADVHIAIVQSIPRGSIVPMPASIPEDDRAALHAQLVHASGHDHFALVFVDPGDMTAVNVLGPDQVVASLRATMADDVRAEVLEAARTEAARAASQAVAGLQPQS